MPRHNKSSWKNQYEDPDAGFNSRRVNFRSQKRPSGNRNEYVKKDWGAVIRDHLDEDIDMVGSASYRINKRSGKIDRKGKRNDGGHYAPRKLIEGSTSWYRVSVMYGDKYEKPYLQKMFLDNLAPLPFIPVQWSTMGNNVIFFVDGFKVAEKILSLDRRVQLPNGYKLFVKVQPGAPNVDVTPALKERIKLVMGKRYNAATKALDLTCFHTDPDLQDVFCALFKPIVFVTVLDIILDNIPEIEALNLYDNNISIISFMKMIVKKLLKLKVLHIGKNKIRDISQLDPLIGLSIVDLVLEGNPACDKFKDKTSYISEVRKRFPKVIKLDGIDLPPPIGFDIQEEIACPEKKQTFLCNTEGQNIVRQFLQQYYELYDSDRNQLLQAYHDNASFSLTMAYPFGSKQDKSGGAWLNWYNTDNRNVLKITDLDRRFKLLKQGKVAVCNFLDEMPKSKHDIHGFTVDLTLFTPVMLCLSVTGMFKELKTGHKIPPLRYFFRTMVIVPAGSGFCIVNDELHVTNATNEQAKEAFKTPIPAPAPTTTEVPTVVPAVPSEELQQQMCNFIRQETGMNLEWSMKCLQETQWDQARALAAFRELHLRNSIPPEAFV